MSKFKTNMFNELEVPTIILSTKYHKHLGTITNIDSTSINSIFNMNSCQELSFDIYKELDGKQNNLWNSIVDFKYIFIPEYEEYYEINVSLDEDNKAIKHITATSACEAELKTRKLRNFECNTETDILRDDYVPTVLYDSENPNASLLDRVLIDKCPDYSIAHVDDSIASMQRIFSVDNNDIYTFFTKDVAEEIECLFRFDSVNRTISVYDLKNVCSDCGNRNDNSDTCSNCGGHNFKNGYGENTAVYISCDNYAKLITVEGDSDNVFNCLKVEGGDDLMTATIANINPNGTNYIRNFSSLFLDDMPDELVEKLKSYNELYDLLQPDYQEYTNKLYDSIDEELYLTSKMMPTVILPDTSAEQELANLYSELNSVSVTNINSLSKSSADLAIIGMAKVIVDARYKVEIVYNSSSISGVNNNMRTWTGRFIITNIGNEEDTITSSSDVHVSINGNNYEEYLYQKIQKAISKDGGVFTSIFNIDDFNTFNDTLKLYCLDSLKSFESSYNTCLEVLIENGVTNSNSVFYGVNLYESMYKPYYERITAIQKEMVVRENEIYIVHKKKAEYENQRNIIQKQLNFKEYIGDDLWVVYSHYLREDTYSNDNYISDGLDNSELVNRASELFNLALKEVIKTSELQFSLTTTLNNLLSDKNFAPFKDKIQLGNWINIKVDDKLYRLRLIKIEIDYGNLNNISVQFSNVTKINNVISDTESILSQAKSMSCSYDYFSHQASNGNKAQTNVNEWLNNGLNSALVNIKNNDKEEITYDNHGLWAKSYDDITDSYSPEQVRITSNILAFTKDNWLTCSAALGKHNYTYYNTSTKMFETSQDYGLSCTFVQSGYIYSSQIISGDIYSSNYSSTSGTHINLNDGTFSFAGGKLKYDNSILSLDGKITATSGSIGGWTIGDKAIYNNTDSIISTKVGTYIGIDGIRQYSSYSKYVDIKNGTLVAYGADIHGNITTTDITATGGKIGNWTINKTSISQSVETSSGDTYYVSLSNYNDSSDSEVISCSKNAITNFYLTRSGRMFCNDANIIGKITTSNITATGGTIGGWNINDSAIYKDYVNYRAYIQTPSSSSNWVFSTQTKKDDGKYYPTFYVKQDGMAYFGNKLTIAGNLNIAGDTVFTNTNKWIYIGNDGKRWLPRTYGETESINGTNFYGISDIYGSYANGKMTLVVKFYNVPFNGGDGNKNYFTYYIDITDQDYSYSFN